MSNLPKPGDKSREADYADYENRDLRDGWPYADEDSAKRRGQETGRPSRTLGEDEPDGMEVSDRPGISGSGGPRLDRASEHETIDDDDLEERIFNLLGERDDLDASNVTVTVHGGVATLAGSVETREHRSLAIRLARSVAGVRETVNELETTDVGSHIPPDYDD